MRTSIHRGFSHPMGGVSPMKQEDNFPDPNRSVKVQVEEKEEKKKTTKKKKREVFSENLEKNVLNKESESSEPMNTGDKVDLALATGGLTPVYGVAADAANVIQNTGQAIFNAVTGDYKEAKHDATNALWAAGAFIPAGIGQWFTGMKLAKATAKTAKSAKTGTKVTADFLNNASEAEIKASKNLSNTEKAEILNARVNTKIAKEAAEGAVINGEKFYKGATHYGEIAGKDFHGVTKDIFAGVRHTGKVTDDALAKMNWNAATDLKPDNVKRIGTQGIVTLKDGRKVPRGIYEVTYPDGSKQKYWRSTSGGDKMVTLADGTKVTSEGFFGTVAGHMDAPPGVLGEPGSRARIEGVKNWLVKGGEWQGYGSKTYKETGAVLKNMFDSGLIK